MNEAYKIFTKEYYNFRNDGLENCSALTEWEYEQANLIWPNGYTQDSREIEYHTRLGNKLKLINNPYIV